MYIQKKKKESFLQLCHISYCSASVFVCVCYVLLYMFVLCIYFNIFIVRSVHQKRVRRTLGVGDLGCMFPTTLVFVSCQVCCLWKCVTVTAPFFPTYTFRELFVIYMCVRMRIYVYATQHPHQYNQSVTNKNRNKTFAQTIMYTYVHSSSMCRRRPGCL